MAVVNTKSARCTNADATPRVLDSPNVNHGKVRRTVGTIETVSGDSIGSTYRLARVHSSWTITAINLYCDAITTCAADCGLYRIAAEASGAVVAVSCYATAQSLASALTTPTNIHYEFKDIANCQRQVWQDAGLTADPGLWYDVTLTLTAAAGAAGTIVLDVFYVGNE